METTKIATGLSLTVSERFTVIGDESNRKRAAQIKS